MKKTFSKINNTKFLFISIGVFAILLRLYTLGNYETWFDEKVSVWEATGMRSYNYQQNKIFTNDDLEKHNTLSSVISSNILGDAGNGLIYIVCLHYWTDLFGYSDFAIRLFSAILGVLIVVLVYLLTLAFFSNHKIALLTMSLTAIHPYLITYSQEARSYVLALVVTLSATLLLIKMINNKFIKGKQLLIYSLLLAAGFLTHYFTIYIFAAHFFILLFFFQFNFIAWRRIFSYLLITAGILLFWYFTIGAECMQSLASRSHNYEQLSLKDPSNSFYMKTSLYSIGAGCIQNLFFSSGNTFVYLDLHLKDILPLILIPIILLLTGLTKTENSQRINIKILLLLIISSLIYATTISLITGHIMAFQPNYCIFSTPYMVTLIGWSIYTLLTLKMNKYHFLLNTLITLQIIIMSVSTVMIYSGLDSHSKSPNHYEIIAEKIRQVKLSGSNEFTLIYKDYLTAMEMNRYLGGMTSNVKQVVDTTNSNPAFALTFDQSHNQVILIK